MNRSFQAAWLCMPQARMSCQLLVRRPAGPGEPGARAPGGRLERVEILGKQPADNELRRRAQIAGSVYGRGLDRHGDTNIADVLQRPARGHHAGQPAAYAWPGLGYTLVLINGDPAPPGSAVDQLDPRAGGANQKWTKGPWPVKALIAVAGCHQHHPRKRRRRSAMSGWAWATTPIAHLAGTFTFGENGRFQSVVPLSL